MHSCIHVIVTNCFLNCVLNSKDVAHLLPSSHEFNVCVCACAGERAGHRVGETAGNPHWPGWSDPRQTGGDGAKLGTAQKQGWCCCLSSLLHPLLLLPVRVWKMGKEMGWGMTHWLQLNVCVEGHKSKGCDLLATCWRTRGCDPLAAGYLSEGVIRVRGVAWLQKGS